MEGVSNTARPLGTCAEQLTTPTVGISHFPFLASYRTLWLATATNELFGLGEARSSPGAARVASSSRRRSTWPSRWPRLRSSGTCPPGTTRQQCCRSSNESVSTSVAWWTPDGSVGEIGERIGADLLDGRRCPCRSGSQDADADHPSEDCRSDDTPRHHRSTPTKPRHATPIPPGGRGHRRERPVRRDSIIPRGRRVPAIEAALAPLVHPDVTLKQVATSRDERAYLTPPPRRGTISSKSTGLLEIRVRHEDTPTYGWIEDPAALRVVPPVWMERPAHQGGPRCDDPGGAAPAASLALRGLRLRTPSDVRRWAHRCRSPGCW